ncbi:hypothetical protein VCRA2114E5_30060 [Vibrio crassostreae]|nr:hypothetical protein VCRA2114E5_30060 [Vibrio crassostreae]CAK2949546.1 hypothetical protein VCRA2110O2_60059 [Vibrio crassostreae]CAK2997166.1 hypothetical protein VCRA2122O10_60060 [Vibrio crassostreae]CAK3620455.1 hypothetical protein VCRA2126E14_50058 [Vibrio crassostreae]
MSNNELFVSWQHISIACSKTPLDRTLLQILEGCVFQITSAIANNSDNQQSNDQLY